MATLPGLADRTLTISSAGKTFSVTGWKVGWVHGPTALVAAVRAAKQFLTYVSGAPFQPAIATALGLPDAFYADLAAACSASATCSPTACAPPDSPCSRPVARTSW